MGIKNYTNTAKLLGIYLYLRIFNVINIFIHILGVLGDHIGWVLNIDCAQ